MCFFFLLCNKKRKKVTVPIGKMVFPLNFELLHSVNFIHLYMFGNLGLSNRLLSTKIVMNK